MKIKDLVFSVLKWSFIIGFLLITAILVPTFSYRIIEVVIPELSEAFKAIYAFMNVCGGLSLLIHIVDTDPMSAVNLKVTGLQERSGKLERKVKLLEVALLARNRKNVVINATPKASGRIGLKDDNSITWLSEDDIKILPNDSPITIVVDNGRIQRSIGFEIRQFSDGCILELFFPNKREEVSPTGKPVEYVDTETGLAFATTCY